jgi:hypothetical protein
VGSEHPFVGKTVIDANKKKVGATHLHLGLEGINNILQDNNVHNFIIEDINGILLCPEVID